jgi:thiol:disulfide interchange protein
MLDIPLRRGELPRRLRRHPFWEGEFKTASKKILALVLLIFLSTLCFAASSTSNSTGTIELVPAYTAFSPGKPLTIAVHMNLNPGWHTYAENPGDIGKPLTLKWTLPKGFTASAITFPPHKTFKTLGFTQYGYDKEVSFLATITPPTHLRKDQAVTLSVKAHWLVCKETCIPKKAELDITLPISLKPEPNPAFKHVSSSQPQPSRQALLAVGLAFIGGLLLNIMPCVLPVLSLKLLHLKRFSESLAYTLGILVSFWALASLLLVFKAAGKELGWGYQLQSPWIVGGLACLFLILALNLFGFFEIGLGATRLGQYTDKTKGLWGAFFTGVLATAVATPCTAPFMGAALGIALVQPAFIALLIFTSLGLGLAFPFLIIGAIPSWNRFLPKPGQWMNTAKKILGIPLLLTALWLAWVLAVQMEWIPKARPAVHQTQNITWQPFSEEALEKARKEGKAVFVDISAAWCLTCQVNEKTTFVDKDVVKAFRNRSIVAFKADWTTQDPTITRFMHSFNRNGVPVYIYYPKGKEGNVLSEFLTPKSLLNDLQ